MEGIEGVAEVLPDAGAGPVVLGVGVPDVGVPHRRRLLVRLPPAAAGCWERVGGRKGRWRRGERDRLI